MHNKIPEFVNRWWPPLTAFAVVCGAMYTGLTFLVQTEAKELVQKEIVPNIEAVNKAIQQQEKAINDLHRQNSVTDAKLDLLIKMLENQKKLLKQENK